MRTVKQNCYPDGSRQEAIWGANWNPFTQDIVYESLINIRPRQNRAMEILDARIQRTSSSSDSTITGRVRQTMRDKIIQDRTRLQERYLQDDLPTRLGGLAMNLARIQSFSHHSGNQAAVERLLEESKLFIEWTAGEIDIDSAAFVGDDANSTGAPGSAIGNRSG